MDLYTSLMALGLEGKKAKVYIACLELGSGRAQEIAKKAGIQRTTSYEVLDGLVKEGLIHCSLVGQRKVYHAEDPKKFLYNLQEKEKKAEELLPELRSVYNIQTARPKTRFYEGVEGIKIVYEDTLTAKTKTLRAILSMHDLYEVPGKKYMDDYVQRRIVAGVHLSVIRSETKEVEEVWKSSIKELRELRYAPRGMEFAMTMYLYDNKVVLIGTKKENFGMMIESEEFYHLQSNLFEIIWDVSRQTKKGA